MKVLVTGGAGFIGSHLCEALHHEGYQVFALDNLSPAAKKTSPLPYPFTR
jgi:nucleoside-diphosphate-sugar epimerase